MPLVTRVSAYLFLLLSLLGCGEKEAAPPKAAATNSITLVTMTPAAGAKVSKSSTISATVDYTLADNELSGFGYRVAILLQSTVTGTTFAAGPNSVVITDKKGTVRLTYSLASIWDASGTRQLQHPVTCYFYLQRVTSSIGQSTVIAKTPALTFTE